MFIISGCSLLKEEEEEEEKGGTMWPCIQMIVFACSLGGKRHEDLVEFDLFDHITIRCTKNRTMTD